METIVTFPVLIVGTFLLVHLCSRFWVHAIFADHCQSAIRNVVLHERSPQDASGACIHLNAKLKEDLLPRTAARGCRIYAAEQQFFLEGTVDAPLIKESPFRCSYPKPERKPGASRFL